MCAGPWESATILHRPAPSRVARAPLAIAPLTLLLAGLPAVLTLGGSLFAPRSPANSPSANSPARTGDTSAATLARASCTRAGFTAMGSTVLIPPALLALGKAIPCGGMALALANMA